MKRALALSSCTHAPVPRASERLSSVAFFQLPRGSVAQVSFLRGSFNFSFPSGFFLLHLFPQCLSIHIWHLHCVIQLMYACSCSFRPVANMAARRSGSLLFQRCIFCSRETLKRSRDFDARSFSRAKNTFLFTSNRRGIFSSSGENLLSIHFLLMIVHMLYGF